MVKGPVAKVKFGGLAGIAEGKGSGSNTKIEGYLKDIRDSVKKGFGTGRGGDTKGVSGVASKTLFELNAGLQNEIQSLLRVI